MPSQGRELCRETANQFQPFFPAVNTIAPMNRYWLCYVMLFAFATGNAAQLDVRIFDRDGRAVEGIVVALHAASAKPLANVKKETATMDQIDQRFVPFVLPVRTGTAVLFPNSDSVAHQVYSFSPTKRFELGLYRGRPHAPVVFDTPGIVVLGCNIHDKMIGYVYVTDATAFGKTNELGQWQSKDLAAGDYQIEVWSPLLARDEDKLTRTVHLEEGATAQAIFNLTRAMRSPPRAQGNSNLRDY